MTAVTDSERITRTQQFLWATGNYHICAISWMPAAQVLVDAIDPHAGQSVLDVACGSGNAAIAAARRYCNVTALDYVPALLERGRLRAAAEQVDVTFVEGDAQALPFPDASFDFVVSAFGAMFAPDQEKAAQELLRVCKPGGKIGLANHGPDGVGGFLPLVENYVPPPAGLQPPTRWGTEQGIRALFQGGASDIQFQRRRFAMYLRSVEHLVEIYRNQFGPTMRAFKFLNAERREALHRDMIQFLQQYNVATDGTLVLDCEYAEAIVTRL